MYVVTVIKGNMDVINVQLEKQHVTDAKRKGTTALSVTKMGAGQHSSSSETNMHTAFLDALTGYHHSSWIEEIFLNDHSVQFKLDTGVEVTAVSEAVFANLKDTKLQKASQIILRPAQQKLKVLG